MDTSKLHAQRDGTGQKLSNHPSGRGKRDGVTDTCAACQASKQTSRRSTHHPIFTVIS